MKLLLLKLTAFAICLLPYYHVAGQTSSSNTWLDSLFVKFPSRGMYFPLTHTGSSYVKLGVSAQFWLRYLQNNPGSVNSNGELVEQQWDMALRRNRFSFVAHVEDRLTVYTQIGINSQSYLSGGAFSSVQPYNKKPGLFVHDFWSSMNFIPGHLTVGAGLHFFNGLSRLSSVSCVGQLTLDNPVFNFPDLEHADQVGRQIGVFATGSFSRLSYRLALNKPFAYQDSRLENPPLNMAIEKTSNGFAYQGYVSWQFFDREQSALPFNKMTYLGTKKLLNLGGGFNYHPGSAMLLESDGAMTEQDRLGLALDLYSELPLHQMGLLTTYLVWYQYQLGTNYLRSSGRINLAEYEASSDTNVPQGGGIKEFVIGTGDIAYAQIGYRLPARMFPGSERIQPFLALTRKNFEGLGAILFQQDFGLNFYLSDQHFKLTIQYANRPVYEGSVGEGATGRVSMHKGVLTFQTQILL